MALYNAHQCAYNYTVKLRDLIKTIKAIGFHFERNGKEHDLYRLGGELLAVPRHNEVKELTAKRIIKKAEMAAEKLKGQQ